MMTIKHIVEFTDEAAQEEIIPAPYGCYYNKGHLWVYEAKPIERMGVPVRRIWGGKAYVMNGEGQTVAHYHLRSICEETGEPAAA